MLKKFEPFYFEINDNEDYEYNEEQSDEEWNEMDAEDSFIKYQPRRKCKRFYTKNFLQNCLKYPLPRKRFARAAPLLRDSRFALCFC